MYVFLLVRDVGCCTGVCVLNIKGVRCLYYVIDSLHLTILVLL